MRTFLGLTALLAVVAGACGGKTIDVAGAGPVGAAAPPPVDASPSAKRLVPLGYRVAGVAFDGDLFHDTKLGIDCRAVDLRDGTAACLPKLGAEPMHGGSGCGGPGVAFFLGAVDASYATLTAPEPQAPGVPIRLGALHDASGTFYTVDETGACAPFDDVAGALYDYTPLPMATFVTGKTVAIPIGSGLVETTVSFDDGSVAALGNLGAATVLTPDLWGADRIGVNVSLTDTGAIASANLWDRARGEACNAVSVTDGTTYCVPASALGTAILTYGDPACTQLVYAPVPNGDGDGDPEGQIIRLLLADGAERLALVGAAHVGAVVYEKRQPGACVASSPKRTSWELDPLPADAAPEVPKTPL